MTGRQDRPPAPEPGGAEESEGSDGGAGGGDGAAGTADATSADVLPPEVLRAREIILRHGWNATAYQLLNPGILLWFGNDGDSVVGYVRHLGVHVVAGAPVCAASRLPAVRREFEQASHRARARVCYFGAGRRLEQELRDQAGRALVLLGAQPVWHPGDFESIVQGHRSLRAQLHRAQNKGVRVVEWPAARAHDDAKLSRVLRQWLATRGLPPLHFLVEPATLSRLFDRRVFVAERDGEPVGFLVASPVPARDGWLVEQLVRGRQAPNGCNELLVTRAMEALAASGARYATLGLAPLSVRAGLRSTETPPWLHLTLRWVRAHGRRFYNFDGLDAFKAKLLPQRWEPIYAISREPEFSPRTLYAIAAAFSGGSPVGLLARALGRAVVQEARWARARR